MYAQRHKHTKSLIVGYTVSKETQDIEMRLDNDGLMLLYCHVFTIMSNIIAMNKISCT